ncbi:unnamed protein product [Leptidea sinapis]|uniref:Uncharacterized protein n=1 Tax=Leptidea sinapis TaxID=189913 RepID=A0A5E4QBS2_9NEOP|nr:unnamed protein product [Leptidea sinapis]
MRNDINIYDARQFIHIRGSLEETRRNKKRMKSSWKEEPSRWKNIKETSLWKNAGKNIVSTRIESVYSTMSGCTSISIFWSNGKTLLLIASALDMQCEAVSRKVLLLKMELEREYKLYYTKHCMSLKQ